MGKEQYQHLPLHMPLEKTRLPTPVCKPSHEEGLKDQPLLPRATGALSDREAAPGIPGDLHSPPLEGEWYCRKGERGPGDTDRHLSFPRAGALNVRTGDFGIPGNLPPCPDGILKRLS